MNYTYSTDNPKISEAVTSLLIDNVASLINYIYSNQEIEPYNNPEIRIGLSIKILLKTNNKYYDIIVLQPIINDINNLMNNPEYLSTFENQNERLNCLAKELILINKLIELSETITLNKLH